jgi:uncharacterized protein YfaT (DUF1175 family)
MSSKFGLPEDDVEQPSVGPENLSQRLATFQPSQPNRINLQEVDSAAAKHGFVSREPSGQIRKQRRRLIKEATQNLGIRLPISQFQRFVRFCDKEQLNYHDAVIMLLDKVGAD